MLVCDKKQLCEWLLCGIPNSQQHLSRMQCKHHVHSYIATWLARSCRSRSLNTRIIWHKIAHELCILIATETIAMRGSLLLHWTTARLYRVWQKKQSFLEALLATPSSLETMNGKHTTGWQLNSFFTLQKWRLDGCEQQWFFIALIIGSKKLFE